MCVCVREKEKERVTIENWIVLVGVYMCVTVCVISQTEACSLSVYGPDLI